MDLKERIDSLPVPNIFLNTKVDDIKKENIKILQGLNEDWIPKESDANMMHIEVLSYKEAQLKTLINSIIKTMLPHYAKDEDLDNFIFGFYAGEERLLGEEPTAPYEFAIEEVLSKDVIIPKGLILTNKDDTYTSTLKDDVVIKAGTLKAEGKVELNKKTKESLIRTEIVVSPNPYLVSAKAKEDFSGGSNKETDLEFFQRAILSLNKYSTAGSEKAYEYFSYKADERVKGVKVLSPSGTLIDVVIKASSSEVETVAAVDAVLNEDKVQCFTDVVTVRAAKTKTITLEPTIHLIDQLLTANTDDLIKKNINKNFKIGEGLPFSKIIKALEVANVYKVELAAIDLEVEKDEVLNINFNPNYVKASL